MGALREKVEGKRAESKRTFIQTNKQQISFSPRKIEHEVGWAGGGGKGDDIGRVEGRACVKRIKSK